MAMDIKIYTSSELNVRSILGKCITHFQINSYFVKRMYTYLISHPWPKRPVEYHNSLHRDIILSDQLHLTYCINHSLWVLHSHMAGRVLHSHMAGSDKQLVKQNNDAIGQSITVTTSMQRGPPSDDISHPGTQQILCPVWNSTVHSCVHRSTPLNPVLTPLNLLSTFAPHCRKTHFNITFQYMAESPTFQMAVFNTLRMGLLNCLNAHSRGLTFRHRASCI